MSTNRSMNNEDGKETYPLQKRVQKIGIKVSAATEVETRKKRVERETWGIRGVCREREA